MKDEELEITIDNEILESYKQSRMKELIPKINNIISEQDLIEKTKSETMIVHFYDPKFKTCEAMDRELNKIFLDFCDIKFYRIRADVCPMVADKLGVKVLPFLGFFKEGYFVDQIVGFDGMGDDRFVPERLVKRIKGSNIYKPISFIQ